MFSFIETKLFTRLVQEYLTHDEYSELKWFLASEPESGPVIPGNWWSKEASVAGYWSRQAWWVSNNLLRKASRRRDLDADYVFKERY